MSSIFNNDPKDPFNQTTKDEALDSNWIEPSENSCSQSPTWKIKTEQEQKDHIAFIQRLEAKMKRIKQQAHYNYNAFDENAMTEGEDLSDDDDKASFLDMDEGRPLLKSTTNNIKKTEDQYTRPSFYCCCWSYKID